MSDQENTGIFLNGKGQIIEMLKIMPSGERNKLISNLKIKNPQLAEELAEASITFEIINELSHPDMTTLFENILPQVMGLALKGAAEELQRKVLAMAPRDYAEKAFNIMVTPFDSNVSEKVAKAQNKVINTLAAIARRKRRLYS